MDAGAAFDIQGMYEQILAQLKMTRCNWIYDRLSENDMASVQFFVDRLLNNGQRPFPGENLMVHRILNDPDIVRSNHTYL